MKNLQIGEHDLIGRKFNGHDLHYYLMEKGIESSHLVAIKESTDKNTYVFIRDKEIYSQNNTVSAIEWKYSIHCLNRYTNYEIIYDELFLNSDIVHYHLIHNYLFNFQLLPLMCDMKPSVFSVHAPWVITGRCIHFFDCQRWQQGCGDCPDIETPYIFKKDNTALNYEIKRRIFQNSQISLIVASDWMKNLVEQAPITQGLPVYKVPFGINQDIYKPGNIKEAKKELGIDEDSFTIMFRSEENVFKGMDYIKHALSRIQSPQKITLITVSQPKLLEEFKDKFNIIEHNSWIKDDSYMAKLYQASDIFIMPSKAESFGLMAIEAMSCGKMVLTIDGSAVPEVINAPECGISTERDFDAYTNELQRLIDNPEEVNERGQKSLDFARQNYSHNTYVDRTMKVYEEVIKNHKKDERINFVLEQLKTHMQKPSAENIDLGRKKSILEKALKEIGRFFKRFRIEAEEF